MRSLQACCHVENSVAITSQFRLLASNISEHYSCVWHLESDPFKSIRGAQPHEENHWRTLDCVIDLSPTCLLLSWRLWALSLQRLLLGLWIAAVDATLFSGDDPWHKVWVICGLSTENFADFPTASAWESINCTCITYRWSQKHVLLRCWWCSRNVFWNTSSQ